MLTVDKLKNLRFGPVVRAGIIKEGTAHAWRTRNRLVIGRDPPEGGNRRYDLADAARLTLMRFLTERLNMGAQTAATATNAVSSKLVLLAAQELHAIEYPQRPVVAADYVMVLDRVDDTYLPEVFERAQLAQIKRERILEVRVDLTRLVEYACDNLINAIGESSIDLRERLREAAGETV